jgi:alpha-tubulin suppressor-like RCC1 family protein
MPSPHVSEVVAPTPPTPAGAARAGPVLEARVCLAIGAGLVTACSASGTGPPTGGRLAFITQPPTSVEGTVVMAPAVRVAMQDAGGNTIVGATNAVTVALRATPQGGTLTGTATINAVGGVATFSDVAVDKPQGGYALMALAQGFTPVTSDTFRVKLTFATVSADSVHSCGLTISGAAYCWGDNAFGQLGDTAAGLGSATPVLVVGGRRFSAMNAGWLDGCGLTAAGAGYCWGSDYFGQLGDGDSTYHFTPVPVAGGRVFTAMRAGLLHGCGVAAGSAGYCWGYNVLGQLGRGDTISSTTPVGVSGGLVFAAISPNGYHTCGVTTSYKAYCWGWNITNSLGDSGTESFSTTPVPVAGGLSFAALSVGRNGTCGVTTAGAAYCWGPSYFGALTPIGSGLSFATVSSGRYHSCGVTTGGAGYCWGGDAFGQRGDSGSAVVGNTPVPVSGGLTFTAISAGIMHSCGVTPRGAAYCWGNNDYGQLGNGTKASTTGPTPVTQ